MNTPNKKISDNINDENKKNKKLGDIEQRLLKKYIKKLKTTSTEKISKEKEYSVYGSNPFAKISNQTMGNLTFSLTTKYGSLFEGLYSDIRSADIKMFSKTYVSIMFFSTLLSLPAITFLSLLFFPIPLSILIGFLGMIVTFLVFYFYPKSLVNERSKKIKYDLVFAIVHMAAIAESGAQPIAMFRLLLESKEYKHLDTELKRIINHVNLFGYSLTTALRSVAANTPSYELKELLNGMVSTIETGGDLKSYLKDKASDALIQYRLDQEKYSAQLNTYSDLYTGILIAAPLLFLVTLAIIEKISPNIGTMSVASISAIGTYLVIPLINVGFMIFLNLTKAEL
jgi:archaeal flagellar protein FlaJ